MRPLSPSTVRPVSGHPLGVTHTLPLGLFSWSAMTSFSFGASNACCPLQPTRCGSSSPTQKVRHLLLQASLSCFVQRRGFGLGVIELPLHSELADGAGWVGTRISGHSQLRASSNPCLCGMPHGWGSRLPFEGSMPLMFPLCFDQSDGWRRTSRRCWKTLPRTVRRR